MEINSYINILLETIKYKYKKSILLNVNKLAKIIENEAKIYDFLKNGYDKENKKKIIDMLLKKTKLEIFKNIFYAIIDLNDECCILSLLKAFSLKYQTLTHLGIIKIYTPFKLKKEKVKHITNIINKQMDIKCTSKVIIDKKILGGCVVVGPNFTVDFSINRMINDLQNLVSGKYEA